MGIRSYVKDYPSITTVTVGVGVLVHHAFYGSAAWLPDVAGAMSSFDEAWSIYLGFAGVLAILSGFAGVVIVFAMTPGSERMGRLRRMGGRRLESNWSSPVRSSLIASFGSAACAVIFVAGDRGLAWWLFEFFALVAAVAAIRLSWLLTSLMQVVRAEDTDVISGRHLKPVSVDELVNRRSSSA